MGPADPSSHYSGNRLSDEVRHRSPEWIDATGYDRDRLVLFTHVPKAGGTSLKQSLTRAYGRYFTDHHHRLNDVIAQVADGSRRAADLLAVSSHAPYGWHRDVHEFDSRRILAFTVVRHPLDRMISYYNFVTTFRPHRHHQAAKDLGINEFFTMMIEAGEGEIANGQCRVIARGSRTFDQTRQVLEGEYFAFCPLEELAPMAAGVADALGWPADEAHPGMANQSPPLATIDDLDDGTHGQLLSRNDEDLQLHEYARDRGAVVDRSRL